MWHKEKRGIKVERAHEPFSATFVLKHPWLRRIATQTAASISRHIPATGTAISPYRFAAQGVFIAVMSAPLVALGPLLALFVHPIFLLLIPIPFFLLFVPWLRIRSMIGDRKRSIDEELPSFAIHASIFQTVGLSMYNAFISTIGRGIFKQIENDAIIMQRNTRFFRMSPLEAIEELGRNNPNPKMKALLLGYSSEWRSGGDAARYLEGKASEYLKETESRWRRYVNSVTTVGEVVIILLFLLPVMLLLAVFVLPSIATLIAVVFLSVVIPLLVTIGIVAIQSTQPKSYDELGGNIWAAFAAGTAFFVVTLFIGTPAWMSLIAGLGAATLVFGIPVVLQRREIAAHEQALPQFLRDTTEYQKLGYDLVKGMIKIAEENEYNRAFDRLLGYIAKQLGLGVRFSELLIPSRSWLTRTAFFHLGEVAESGGYASRSLELLTEFSGEVLRMKREARSSMGLYRMLSMATPIGLAVSVGLLAGLLSGFSLFVTPGSATVPGLPAAGFATLPPALMGLSYAIIVVASVGIALLASYAADLTPKNSIWITINLGLAAVGITLVPVAAGLVGGAI